MMRCPLTHPDASLVPAAKAARDALSHAHAGMLIRLSLVYLICLGRAGDSVGVTIDARRQQPTVDN